MIFRHWGVYCAKNIFESCYRKKLWIMNHILKYDIYIYIYHGTHVFIYVYVVVWLKCVCCRIQSSVWRRRRNVLLETWQERPVRGWMRLKCGQTDLWPSIGTHKYYLNEAVISHHRTIANMVILHKGLHAHFNFSSGDRLIDLCIVFLTHTHVVPVLYAVTFFSAIVLLSELRRLEISCSAQVDWTIF